MWATAAEGSAPSFSVGGAQFECPQLPRSGATSDLCRSQCDHARETLPRSWVVCCRLAATERL